MDIELPYSAYVEDLRSNVASTITNSTFELMVTAQGEMMYVYLDKQFGYNSMADNWVDQMDVPFKKARA